MEDDRGKQVTTATETHCDIEMVTELNALVETEWL